MIKFSLLTFVIVIFVGCGHSVQDVTLSERFNVCAKVPEGVAYSVQTSAVDYDVGRIATGVGVAEVYIGGHPRADHSFKRKARNAPQFLYLGREASDEQEKILFAGGTSERGPLFVMFSAADVDPMEDLLTKYVSIFDCSVVSE